MKPTLFIGLFSAALAMLSVNAAEVDCVQLSLSVKKAVAAEQSKMLEIVSSQVAAAPACACEIVKAVIEESKAKPEEVAAIVEAASTAAPEQMRLVSQCAVAVAPDSLGAVQAVVAKLDPNKGEGGYSSKGSKSAKGEASPGVADPLNPLDGSFDGPVPPVILVPPPVTNVNPPGGGMEYPDPQ